MKMIKLDETFLDLAFGMNVPEFVIVFVTGIAACAILAKVLSDL